MSKLKDMWWNDWNNGITLPKFFNKKYDTTHLTIIENDDEFLKTDVIDFPFVEEKKKMKNKTKYLRKQ